ncbi:MAG: hypothetical protein PHP32_05975 [Candidatus Izemoplasmatales bacterium]|nr:hypothetical protein [Candidatus Izemoplasmatales bacterium]
MNRLFDYLHQNPLFRSLAERFDVLNKDLHIQNTTEENALLALAYAYHEHPKQMFLVTGNLYGAQLAYDRLSQIFPPEEVCLFPQDEFITSELLVSSMEFRMERMNTIRRILTGKPCLIVTHPAGLLKPELNKEAWRDAIFTIREGDFLDRDELASKLMNLGYTREYVVEKPGDYSVRGGIVDVYPLGSLNPIRLDFFGDEIETIKSFDLDTQRSLERVQEVVISPMNEFLYSEKELAQLHELIQYKMSQIPFSEEAKKRIQQDLDDLDNHANLDRLARYIPFLTPNKSTILDLATNPQIWFLDHHRILDQIDLMSSEIGEWYLSTDDYPRMGFDLMYAMTDLRIDHAVYVDYFEYLGVHPQAEKISLFGKEVLSYQGNTKLFVQDMRSEIGRKTLVLAVSSYKERSALTALFEEENIPYMLLGDNDKLRENQVNILINSSYFDLTSDVLNLRVISSQTIFQSKSIRRKGRYVSVYQTSKRLSSVNDLQPGDYVVHYDYGIGKFLEIIPAV